MLYVGIDITKHKHDLAIIDTEGTIFIRHLQIENNREGFTKLQYPTLPSDARLPNL